MEWISYYNFGAFDLLGRYQNILYAIFEEQNPEYIPKQEEFSSVLQ